MLCENDTCGLKRRDNDLLVIDSVIFNSELLVLTILNSLKEPLFDPCNLAYIDSDFMRPRYCVRL
jgi:hypothetical protein